MLPSRPLKLRASKFLLLPFTALVPCLAGSAHALGFTGDFAPSNWTLYQNISGGSSTQVNWNSNACPNPTDTSCLVVPDSNVDSATIAGVVGSDNTTGIGSVNDQVDIYWKFNNTLPAGTISFDYQFFGEPGNPSNDYGFFRVGTNNELQTSSETASNFSYSIAAGQPFGFGVYTPNNEGGAGYFEISNFQFTPNAVPGPLPALGAAGAWAWSRRLRSRIRRRSS